MNETKGNSEAETASELTRLLGLLVEGLYGRARWKFISLPFYLQIGNYRLVAYAMNFDWKSLRIKIEDTTNWEIVKVIKEGKY